MTPAGFAGPEDLERIANQAHAKLWPVAVAVGQAVHVESATDTRIVTAAGTLVWSDAREYWYMAFIAAGYTRDDKGREVPIPPRSNLGGKPMTYVEAAVIAVHETARSGCTDMYYPTPAGGA